MKSLLRSLLLFTALLSGTYGQVERASLVGTVTDKSGAVMAGVAVTVTNVATNTSQRLVTDEAGAYSAVNLIPGVYTVQAAKSGFRNMVFKDYTLQVSQAARLDMVMEVGEVNQSVEVTGAAPLLQTENASVGQVIAKEAVQSLPLNGRNFVQLAILAPGVTGLDYAQSNTINSGAGRMNSAPAARRWRPTARGAPPIRCSLTASITRR